MDGVIPRADLWVNGRRVVDASTLAGAYVVQTIDVTDVVQPGLNALALLVRPGNPMEDLSIGWVDWSQSPPDNNMGPWRDVIVQRTGEIRLSAAHVLTSVDADEHPGRADLEVTVEAHNHTSHPQTATLNGTVSGQGAQLTFQREVLLAPGTHEVRFSADEDSLTLSEPALWWPIGEGPQPQYHLTIAATVGGVLSDQIETDFGVRTVDSELRPGGGRQFLVNGRPIQIMGAGWSPDLFLRYDYYRLAAQLALTAHMGLNTVRLEGRLENPEFFELCNELGLMVLPGWECCNKWEAAAGTGGSVWDDHDAEVAERSMADEAELLRNHPSVVAFLIGSDFTPPPEIVERYVRALHQKRWNLPVVASATVQGSEITGPSGMKMTGPYDWVPPVYWYDRDPELGGAVGFNSETSAGHTVPRMPTLRRALSPTELDRLWQQPELPQYHSGPPSVFDNLRIFTRALSERYGPARSAEDFVAKSQLAGYEAVRAQFEAFASRARAEQPATGVVYWMLTAPWPSLNWQLFDCELDTPGAYSGARKALEPLHVSYAYDTKTVQVFNRTGTATAPLAVTVRSWRPDGDRAGEACHHLDPLPAGAVVDVVTIEPPAGLIGAWFLELELTEAVPVADPDTPSNSDLGPAATRSRNVYWLSSADDVLDRATTTWHSTGVSQFADLRALESMRSARVRATASAARSGSDLVLEVTLHNEDPSNTPAVALHTSVTCGGEPLTPVLWDDNDVTLFTGPDDRPHRSPGGCGRVPMALLFRPKWTGSTCTARSCCR